MDQFLGESPELREKARDALKEFLRHTKLMETDAVKRANWIQETTNEKLTDTLSVMNGLLQGGRKFQRWEGKAVKSIVSMTGSTDAAELEPPEHAEEEFDKLLTQIKDVITETSMQLCASKLFVGIILSHLFPDANGRTARTVYRLVQNGVLPKDSSYIERTAAVQEISASINNAAIAVLFQKEGVLTSEKEDFTEHYVTTDGISAGLTDHLKYLAVRRVLFVDGNAVPPVIAIETLGPEQRIAYGKAYADIRQAWFWTAQEVVDQYQELIIGKLNDAIPVS